MSVTLMTQMTTLLSATQHLEFGLEIPLLLESCVKTGLQIFVVVAKSSSIAVVDIILVVKAAERVAIAAIQAGEVLL